MRKQKMRKVGLCFITGCFIKPFQIIINHFFISEAHSQRNFHFFIIGISKGETGNRKIARDGKLNIYFKNNFNLLVMNVTQLNFLN